jgi:hypothetical protein
MRNIHVLNQQIYITTDEEIKEGDYFLYDETTIRYKTNGTEYHGGNLCHISGIRRYPISESKKIILTTNPLLGGVQAIDDEFLEWFSKNPSREFVPIITTIVSNSPTYNTNIGFESWRKEEPKQDKRMYSEEEVIALLIKMNSWPTIFEGKEDITDWFEQFKNKL